MAAALLLTRWATPWPPTRPSPRPGRQAGGLVYCWQQGWPHAANPGV